MEWTGQGLGGGHGASAAALLRDAGGGAALGRAAEREHIVQSALSQQVQRLERELGVRLLERSTHHVALTAAGVVFLVEARQILAHAVRAADAARNAAGTAAPLRVGIIDSSYDSMPQILHEVQARYPGLVIHQVEASAPEQYEQLIDGRLDVGVGRAALAPSQIASLLFRQDPLGSWSRPATRSPSLKACQSPRSPGNPSCSPRKPGPRNSTSSPSRCAAPQVFTPAVLRRNRREHPGGRRPRRRRALPYCVPSSCIAALPGTIWRPLTEPNRTTRGRSCGAPPTTPATCAPSSAALRPCQNASAGWLPPAWRCTERSAYRARDTAGRFSSAVPQGAPVPRARAWIHRYPGTTSRPVRAGASR